MLAEEPESPQHYQRLNTVQLGMLVNSKEGADALKELALFSPGHEIIFKSLSVDFELKNC